MAIQTTTPNDAALIDAAPARRTAGRAPKTAALMLAGVALLGVLAGCGGGSSAATPADSASSASTQSSPEVGSTPKLNTAPAARSGDVPTPAGPRREQLLFLLKGTDPGMNMDDDFLVSRAVELCGHMLQGASTGELDKETQKLFSNGSFTPEDYQVMAIQLAITAEFCR